MYIYVPFFLNLPPTCLIFKEIIVMGKKSSFINNKKGKLMVKFFLLATRQTSVNAHNSAFWSHFITVSSV